MRETIVSELDRIARDHQVRIVFACESGSRAWGFASADSDYDVRFVYVHPIEHYLSIEQRRDVIEEMLPGDLDLSGWDLRKALGLARRSNPPLLEWLCSPVVYSQDPDLFPRFRAVTEACYSPEKCYLHYLHMAQGNFREYLQGEEVWLKKYLYVLRPALACRWIERWRDQPVPMEFGRLVEAVLDPGPLVEAIEGLVARKVAGAELDHGPRDPVIGDFIDAELPRLAAAAPESPKPVPAADLDAYFLSVVLPGWPG